MFAALKGLAIFYRDSHTRSINLLYKIFDLAVGFIRQIPFLFQAAAKEKSDGLVKPGIHSAFVFFYYFIAVIAGLPVDQFHQYLSLVNRKIGKRISKTFSSILFPLI